MQWCPYCEKITAHSSDDCPAPTDACKRPIPSDECKSLVAGWERVEEQWANTEEIRGRVGK